MPFDNFRYYVGIVKPVISDQYESPPIFLSCGNTSIDSWAHFDHMERLERDHDVEWVTMRIYGTGLCTLETRILSGSRSDTWPSKFIAWIYAHASDDASEFPRGFGRVAAMWK